MTQTQWEKGWGDAEERFEKHIEQLQGQVQRLQAIVDRQREVLRECRRFIDANPANAVLWASGLRRELDEILKGPLPPAEAAKAKEE